jgi:hypothetical protein
VLLTMYGSPLTLLWLPTVVDQMSVLIVSAMLLMACCSLDSTILAMSSLVPATNSSFGLMAAMSWYQDHVYSAATPWSFGKVSDA